VGRCASPKPTVSPGSCARRVPTCGRDWPDVFPHSRAYRRLVALYPPEFRRDYGDDLVQSFDDLVARDGATRAWARTTVDLCCTVPRYRLESYMNPTVSTFVLQIAVAVLALAGVAAVVTGVGPGAVVLLLVAIVLGASQRSRLARATRTPDPNRRRRFLQIAAMLAIVCVAGSAAMYLELTNDDSWNAGKLLAYNLFFLATAFASAGYLFAGLRTPRSPVSPRRALSA
jgi:hypothetical protein